MHADTIVIGAGIVGSAIAYGLAGRGLRVVALDGGDGDLRAARANFGLVWVQGKGPGLPAYQTLSRRSAELWPEFARELAERTGIALEHEKRGGLAFCFGEAAFETRRAMLAKLRADCGSNDEDFDMLERGALERLVPRVRFGPEVTGASFGRHDGHVNPLRLFAALQAGLIRRGGALLREHAVRRIRFMAPGFAVEAAGEVFRAPVIVIAAGLGTAALAAQVGLAAPLRPERGQVLVTERAAPFLPYPASGIRQTGDGTVMLGGSKEEAGFDVRATAAVGAALGREAVRLAPALAGLKVVRHWAGLRIMTPDSYPIYAQSPTCPGAFAAVCHSGVTLAAFHATALAGAVAAGALSPELSPFHYGRFDVSQAA